MVCRVLDTGPDTGVYTLAEALYGRYCRFIMWVIGGVWGKHRSGCSRLTDERGSGSTLDTVELAELAECVSQSWPRSQSSEFQSTWEAPLKRCGARHVSGSAVL